MNDNLRDVILNVRENIYNLEDLRIVSFQSNTSMQEESTYTLDKFRKMQSKNRNRIKEAIKLCSSNCRELVKEGLNKNIEFLRSEQKTFPNKNFDEGSKKLPKNYTPSSKEAAY